MIPSRPDPDAPESEKKVFAVRIPRIVITQSSGS
jgi:hypothetical protein